MAYAKRVQREEARRLRQQGMAVTNIAKKLNVTKGSASLWVRDIVLTDEQVNALQQRRVHYGAQNKGAQRNRDNYRNKRIAYQEAGRAKAREGNLLHQAGCMLYWAEGAKARNALAFVNSDPFMMCLFMRFLREELQVPNEKIGFLFHCHSTDPIEIERIKRYWLDLLNLPDSCFKSYHIKKGSETSRNTLINGVGRIAVYSSELVQHIYGAIQEYGGFENPEWLF